MLKLAMYEFDVEADADLEFPNPSGVVWKSIFAKALHDLVCRYPGRACGSCQLQYSCDYTALFKVPVPPDAAIMRRYNNIPAPHLFQRSATDTNNSQRHLQTVRFCLIGSATERFSSIHKSVTRAIYNKTGNYRIKFVASEFRQIDQHGLMVRIDPAKYEANAQMIKVPDCPGKVTLEFLSPYKPSGNRPLKTASFDLSALLMAIVRRIDLLRYFYMGDKLNVDFKALKLISCHPSLGKASLQTSARELRSGCSCLKPDLRGFTGSIIFRGDLLQPLWPYVYAGQFLNVGKLSSSGLGQYRLLPSADVG